MNMTLKMSALAAVMAGLTAMTGCTTVKNVFGKDTTGTHQVHQSINRNAPVTAREGILVDASKMMTLYTYDKDTPNKSNCGAVCLTAWPAFLAPGPSTVKGERYSTIQRDDGKYQWAIDGKPLYFYAQDTAPGDKKGENSMKVWHTVPAN